LFSAGEVWDRRELRRGRTSEPPKKQLATSNQQLVRTPASKADGKIEQESWWGGVRPRYEGGMGLERRQITKVHVLW